MKTLTINTDRNQSFEQWLYPDGATQVRLKPEVFEQVQLANDIAIISHINHAQDIINLLMLGDAVSNVKMPSAKLSLILPYYPYARADRRFVPGDCFGLEMFEKLLDTICWNEIITFDKHSAVSYFDGRRFPQLISVSSWPTVEKVIFDLDAQNVNLLLPDYGATKRYTVPMGHSDLHSKHDIGILNVLLADKKRDPAIGKLSGFIVPSRSKFVDGPVLIPDDICDGGGTFIGIADELKDYGLDLHLYVSHGIFSKGYTELLKRFKTIHTTNTLQQEGKPQGIIVHDVMSRLLGARAPLLQKVEQTA